MKRICLFTLLLMLLVPGAGAAQTASSDSSMPLDLPGYTSELERWSAAARRLREHPNEAVSLRKQLPEHWSVAVREQRFLVSTQWLGVALDGIAANPRSAADTSQDMRDRLDSMLHDSEALGQVSEVDFGTAHAKLADILKRREFRSVGTPSPVETLWDRLTDWVWNFVNKLFSRVAGHPAATKALLWAVVIGLGLAFLVWLIYSLSHISPTDLWLRHSAIPGEGPAAPSSWQEWAERARAAAARGEYRDAIRILYAAAVRRLEEAGAWRADPARTHREYVRLIPADSLQRPPLLAITTCFERVWYGHAQASAIDYEAALAELESLP